MKVLITAGPTYESLDRVRRLTNFSTGRLGCELSQYLTGRGHRVTLIVGEMATWTGNRSAESVEVFTNTVDLRERLMGHGTDSFDAVFHAAAVSDFRFGKVWRRTDGGKLEEEASAKFETRAGNLLVELTPTPKIILELRNWYPRACLVGWKYEAEGDRLSVLAKAEAQIEACRTDACVANGPAYGRGFGLVTRPGVHLPLSSAGELFAALGNLIESR